MNVKVVLIVLIGFISLTSFGQNELNRYRTMVDYNLEFTILCEQLEELYTPEKQAFFAGERDNDYAKFKRWETYWRDRLTGDNKLPDEAQLDADLQVKMNLIHNPQQKSSNSVWEFVGPDSNTGGYWGMGRVTDIAFHPTDPNIFFVGSAKGGLWKTVDGGASYFSLGDDLPYNSVGNLVVNQNNPDEIYVALGVEKKWWEDGIGVYKTTDGGLTWSATSLTFNFSDQVAIVEMAASPLVNDLLFVGTTNGFYRSTDGQNFTNITAGLPTVVYGWNHPYELAFHPTDPNIIYLAWWDYQGTNLDVFKSTDAGLTWNNVTNFTFTQNGGIAIATSVLNPTKVIVQTVVGSSKMIHYSLDEGSTWTSQSNLAELESSPLCISPLNENTIYSGYTKVRKSVDNGDSFQNIAGWTINNNEVHADQWIIKVNPLNNVMYWGNDGGVFKYDEVLDDWTELNNGLSITQIYRIAVGQNQPDVYFFGSQDNGGGYYTQATGWVHGNGGDAMNNAIAPDDYNLVYSTYPLGIEFYRTTNGWASSTNIVNNISGYGGNADWLSPMDADPNNSARLVAASDEVYFSANYGNTWVQLTNGETGGQLITDIRFSPADGNSIYAVTNNRIIETSDGGQSWNARTYSNAVRVVPHPSDPDQIWLVRGGYSNNSKVIHSFNRGVTLASQSTGIPNIPVLSLVYDEPSDSLFLGTELGVFASSATNIGWQPYGIGMPATSVSDLDIQESTRSLVAATYGRGIWKIQLDDNYAELSDMAGLASMRIYPNPAHAEITISAEVELEGEYTIYGQDGRLIQQGALHEKLTTVAIGRLNPGIYTVKVLDKDQQMIGVRKVLKN